MKNRHRPIQPNRVGNRPNRLDQLALGLPSQRQIEVQVRKRRLPGDSMLELKRRFVRTTQRKQRLPEKVSRARFFGRYFQRGTAQPLGICPPALSKSREGCVVQTLKGARISWLRMGITH